MDIDAETAALICVLVWGGFSTAEEIHEIVCEEYLEPGEIDGASVRSAIDEEFARKRVAEETWEAETDCDRLDAVFERLNADGIIALHNAGTTLSDGISDVSDCYHRRGGEESNVIGYCFYHSQDVERAVSGDGLSLAFGDVGGDDERGAEIGGIIRRQLEEAGFRVVWDGDVGTRLLVDGIVWRRRAARS